MLGKLFKYDMRALSRTLVPLHAAVLALVAMGCAAGFAGYAIGEDAALSDAGALLAALALATLFCLLALFASTVATFVLVLSRFYRNLFTDEGYLTLTLPVTANQVMLSKTLAGLRWVFMNVAVVGVGAALVSLATFGFAGTTVEDTLPYWMLSVSGGGFFGTLFGIGGWGSVVLGLVGTACQLVFGVLLAYLSLVLGARMAQRHKVAAGIGMYLLISWVIGLVGSVVGVAASAAAFSAGSPSIDYEAFSLFLRVAGCALTAGMSVACYALCVNLLKKAELA